MKHSAISGQQSAKAIDTMRFLLKAGSYMLIALIRKWVFPDEHYSVSQESIVSIFISIIHGGLFSAANLLRVPILALCNAREVPVAAELDLHLLQCSIQAPFHL
jgi:hypothetical protein